MAEGATGRVILHADMDAFYASVEQRDAPELRGRPVVVGGPPPRGVVTAASYEARVFGVHSAMPSAQAQALCPHAVFVRGDMRKYARESRRIFRVFRRYTPAVEGLSLDEAFLDLTGTERLQGDPVATGHRLRAEVRRETELSVSVGIAPVKLVAKIASELAKPDGLLAVPADRLREFLDPLPASRIWGVGPVARARLESLGIHSVGDLARADDEELRRHLGSFGPAVARLARGEDAREVEPYREPKSYGEENTFGEDVTDRRRLHAAIRAHAESVGRRLRRDRLQAFGVILKVKLARPLGGGRYPLVTRSTTLVAPTNDGAALARAARDLLERVTEPEAIRLIGVAATRLESAAREQLELWPHDPDAARRDRLNQMLDAIRERFGGRAVGRGVPEVERAGLSLAIRHQQDEGW